MLFCYNYWDLETKANAHLNCPQRFYTKNPLAFIAEAIVNQLAIRAEILIQCDHLFGEGEADLFDPAPVIVEQVTQVFDIKNEFEARLTQKRNALQPDCLCKPQIHTGSVAA